MVHNDPAADMVADFYHALIVKKIPTKVAIELTRDFMVMAFQSALDRSKQGDALATYLANLPKGHLS
jgi:hypothetical protein